MKRMLDALISDPSASKALSQQAPDLRIQLAALHPSSFTWAMSCCGHRREDAEDLLHDVYMNVLERRAQFDGRSTFKTWLFGVIARSAKGRARRDRLRAFLGATRRFRMPLPSPPHPADRDVLIAERRARVRTALDQLSARQRAVLLLVFYHDLTLEEAAVIIGITVGSARVHYQRGKARLVTLLPEDA